MASHTLSTGSLATASRARAKALLPLAANARVVAPLRLKSSPKEASHLRKGSHITMATSGSSEEVDFDKVLSDLADKFEASNNKAAIVGYSAAAVAALWFSEWLIHLPLLNFLLGFPIQLLGLALLPYFGVKYFVENDSFTNDAGDAFNKVVKRLPGLEK